MTGITGVSQTTSTSLPSLGLGGESSARSSSPENRRAGDAPLTIAPEDDRLNVCSCELGQDQTLKILKVFPNRGNAVYGCSGTFVLNLASLRDGIEHIAVFDLSTTVKRFWEGASKIIASLDPTKLEESQQKFLAFIGDVDIEQLDSIQSDIANGRSFLSSPERLARVCKVFKARHFTFAKLDLGNPEQFKAFLDEQTQRGAKPHAVYISNIVHMAHGAIMHASDGTLTRHSTLIRPERYKDFERSLNLIPPEAILIDAVHKDPLDPRSTQRVHLKGRVGILPPPCKCAFIAALDNDDYDEVRYSIEHGSDAGAVDKAGFTYLMMMADRGKVNSMRALLDCKVDANSTGEGNQSRKTALLLAAIGGHSDAIELLVARKADIDAGDDQQLTPLHQATGKGHVKAVRTLIELGANRNAKDKLGDPPIVLTKLREMDVVKMKGTPAYREIHKLLLKGLPRREAKEPARPSQPASATASAGAGAAPKAESKKSNADKADGKSG